MTVFYLTFVKPSLQEKGEQLFGAEACVKSNGFSPVCVQCCVTVVLYLFVTCGEGGGWF